MRNCWLIVSMMIVISCGSTADPANPGLQRVACWFPIPADRAAACYRFTVPESRFNGAQRTITLPVAILSNPATRRHADPIVYLTGGPGSAVGLYARTMVEWWPYMDEVPWLRGRDLILMDQRGAGLAEPSLDCPEIEHAGFQLLKLSGDPTRRRALYERAAEACRKRWLAAGHDLGAYDSAAAAADFAALRSALGIAEWNLYGISYGTRLALTLMRDHPEGLRSAILDSVYPPEYRFFENQRAAIERAFDAVAAACAADDACHQALPDLKKTAAGLIERYRAQAVVAFVADPQTGKAAAVPFTGGLLVERMMEIVNEEDALRELPSFLGAAARGDVAAIEETLAELAASYSGPNYFSEGRYLAVDCEEELPFTDEARLRSDKANHPLLADFGLMTDDLYLCPAWVGEDARLNSKDPIISDVPALVLQGEFDTLTPPEIGRITASRLRRGHFVQFPQVGHKVIDQSVCGQVISAQFLDNPEEKPADPCLAGRPQRPAW